ncbi:PREDICTED: claspin homolog [Papilio xuthus]|uniref:Claspin homolog n=1 Tax=Papilio xuthus TaxID=66420 RepID=A0AAJ7EBM5_PAPXU|nr:PREDICTED: claspin homolog [Papilio xuthus]
MTEQVLFYNSIKDDMIEKLVNTVSPDGSADDTSDSFKGEANNLESEDELDEPMLRSKKRVHHFSDSSSESDDLKKNQDSVKICDSEDMSTLKIGSKHKSRIRTLSISDEDLNETAEKTTEKYDLSRVKNKKSKLREKFRNLVSKQDQCLDMDVSLKEELNSKLNNINSDKSDEEQVSCNKIKQTFKDKHMQKISAICDPDSSSDEDDSSKQKKTSSMKSIRLTSPKPIKISAKQAMENKQKIKSESNRMLREKEVSLPYHRPKALSLKDIMSRRKPALASDGKVLSVKMTPEQLVQYALQLEQRQKEMMELCKSDTEEDDDKETKENDELPNIQTDLDKTPDITKIDTDNEPMEIVPEDKVDTKMIVSEDLNPIEFTTIAENIDIKKDSFNKSVDDIKELESSEENKVILDTTNYDTNNSGSNNCEKDDSQNMELYYDSEKIDTLNLNKVNENQINKNIVKQTNSELIETDNIESEFLENDFNFDEIDDMIENIADKGNKRNRSSEISLTTKPKLTGAPGMVIDLEDNSLSESKLSGVEQLKEKFKYFARLKSLEEQEKDREKKYKPGVQLLKLKQELEEQIAEQRSLEWTKRLEQKKQLEMNENHNTDVELDDIEKVEAKLEELNNSHISNKESSEESEEEICEDDCIIEDKPRKRNPMIDEEAEESDVEDAPDDQINEVDNGSEGDASDEDSSEDESSDSHDEENSKPKKGRILKAFEDSDDEGEIKENIECNDKCDTSNLKEVSEDLNISSTQDEELQLAQVSKTTSEEIISQEPVTQINTIKKGIDCDPDLGSQTFSIANTGSGTQCLDDLISKEINIGNTDVIMGDNLFATNASQNSQELITPTQSQEIGEDILALCTGKFYDNPFVSQIQDTNEDKILSNKEIVLENNINKGTLNEEINKEDGNTNKTEVLEKEDVRNKEKEILSSILEELDDPQFESPKKYKYFANDSNANKENEQSEANKSIKKKLVIDSDDEVDIDNSEKGRKNKIKKRKLQQRALQFSDDEEEMEELQSDVEDNIESDIEDVERIVEYDSEENEVEVQPQKKKKKIGEFFEQEAELTSEDEWIGSGDEDEAGLDRMEREEGDDDVFHEGKLRKELGQIHMRDVLDQDKREVRLIKELLLEDGDLGDGHRQRKFRWKNAEDTEETGAAGDEFADTQEEEFESEELWRKQRHEREMFLKKMKGEDEDLNSTSINRSALIKANLISKSATNPATAPNKNIDEDKEKEIIQEKKTHKDIPSPKKPFAIFQQNYHGSLLSRGKGALARLAAIATPLAGDGETTKVSASTNRRNFVFAALSQDEVEPKVSKRKADTVAPSPVLIKKLKAEEKRKTTRSSLFDYLDG